ncbi:hypothetical protein [Burkholderia seminalis]|uniref:hypothetical protein n=1 Tax=Burkholderia seminalis TaxID=488731 RepID=UPI0035DD6F20
MPPLLDAIVAPCFRPDVNFVDPVPAASRAALASLPADRLRQSIVPLGRLIFGRPDTLPARHPVAVSLATKNSASTPTLAGRARADGVTKDWPPVGGCRFRIDARSGTAADRPARAGRLPSS